MSNQDFDHDSDSASSSGEDAAFEHMRRETSHTRPSTAPARAKDTPARQRPQPEEDEEGTESESDTEGEEEGNEPEPQPQQRNRSQVPLSAVQEERRRRQEVERERDELRARDAAMQERFRLISAMQERNPQPLDADIPDPNQNPVEFLAWQRQEAVRQREAQQRQSVEQQERQRQEQQWNNFVSESRRQTQEFVRSNDPDAKHFDKAYEFVKTSRYTQLTDVFGFDQQQAAQLVQQEEANLIGNAMRMGKNPGKAVMELARSMGWNRPDQQLEEDPDVVLDRVERGRQRNASLSSAGRGTSDDNGSMTPEKWLKLPLEEAERWANKNPAKFKRLMGG